MAESISVPAVVVLFPAESLRMIIDRLPTVLDELWLPEEQSSLDTIDNNRRDEVAFDQ